MREVKLLSIKIDETTDTPVLLLQEIGGSARTLPIYIGHPEASAIALHFENIKAPRPLTHDLFKDLFDLIDVSLERVVITELRNKVFYAEMHVISSGKRLSLSCRPSDGVAIAIRIGAPIFVSDELMEEEGLEPGITLFGEIDDSQSEDAIVGEFQEFLKNVRPEDFSS